MKVLDKINGASNPAILTVSLVAGAGVVVAILALAVGVVQGSAADSGLIGLLFAAGVLLFVLGAGAWIGIAQPHRHFDDISQPMDDGHHGHDAQHDADHAEHAQEHASAGHH